ncbi:probable hydrolase PNKD isoform X3 [Nematostella vectensis]|uniref:probable hydrolase PNKD isoform X3 n=1 Tax=Nematostella vectensis TaxID=45351 RepID=UPI0020777568|nr:probable hydrolase PNKD isoform X3 [Nematostella vectensis]
MFWIASLFTVAVIIIVVLGKCFRMNSLLFQIGYTLYSKTQLGYWYHLHQLNNYKATHDEPHSIALPWIHEGLKIIPVPFLHDNYSYIIVDITTSSAVVVDPSDPEAVKDVLNKEKLQLEAVLTTHKHCLIKANITTIKIASFKFTAFSTPGHTAGHVVYLLHGAVFNSVDSLFSGDLLFLGGCGRIFEGAPGEMLESLQTVSSLKDDTLLWPGHDYAMKNLMFALTIEPSNYHLRAKMDWVVEMRNNKYMTSPSTIGEEKLYNPFLRTHLAIVGSAVGFTQDDDVNLRAVSVLKALRERKNNFK